MLACLAHMEEYDPCGAACAETLIWEGFASTAGVTLEELKHAYKRIVINGYYGPISDDEWYEQEQNGDGEPMTMKRAMQIMNSALEYEPDIRYTHPDHVIYIEHEEGEGAGDEPDVEEIELRVEKEAVLQSCFPEIKTIYGGWL